MGLDDVEIAMLLEDAFGISFSDVRDQDGPLDTARRVASWVVSRLPPSDRPVRPRARVWRLIRLLRPPEFALVHRVARIRDVDARFGGDLVAELLHALGRRRVLAPIPNNVVSLRDLVRHLIYEDAKLIKPQEESWAAPDVLAIVRTTVWMVTGCIVKDADAPLADYGVN